MNPKETMSDKYYTPEIKLETVDLFVSGDSVPLPDDLEIIASVCEMGDWYKARNVQTGEDEMRQRKTYLRHILPNEAQYRRYDKYFRGGFYRDGLNKLILIDKEPSRWMKLRRMIFGQPVRQIQIKYLSKKQVGAHNFT